VLHNRTSLHLRTELRLETGRGRHAREALHCRLKGFWRNSGIESEVGMEDGGDVNLARINRGRECMRRFALQSGRRELLRFRSMSFCTN